MTEEQNAQQQEPARPTYKVSSGIPTPEEYESQSAAPAPVEADSAEGQVVLEQNNQDEGEQAPLEDNQSSFSMPSFDGEEDFEGEEGQAAATVVDWKEELKKANPKDILKELGYDDFLAEFAEFRKNGGDAYKYLEAKAFDWETVNHQDLVLDELKLQYPHLTDDKIEKLYQAKYKQSEYASDDDK